MKTRRDGFPRRGDLNLFTTPEKVLWDAMKLVDHGPGHPLLTQAVILLGEARDLVADYVELPENEAWPIPQEPAPRHPVPPVDKTATATTDGRPLDKSPSPSGQQANYLILSDEERARGFQRPVRRTYVHDKCGTTTTMSRELAETYARSPDFYSGTFCSQCGKHFPVGAGGSSRGRGQTRRLGPEPRMTTDRHSRYLHELVSHERDGRNAPMGTH